MHSLITCPNCAIDLRSADATVGDAVRCPSCETRFAVGTIRVVGRRHAQSAESALEVHLIADSDDSENQAAESTDLEDRAQATSPRRSIGRFELRRVLGQGAFGVVYLAFDPALQREVALKIPRFHLSNQKRSIRFLTEARAAAKLRHPHIVPVYESGSADGRLYIASPVVEGMTLSQKLKEGPFAPAEAVSLTARLADALAYAHEEGVVHRDIKPANVMIDQQGSPLIMDFGLAKLKDERSGMTGDGALLGTPMYMAPEQARGANQVTPACDQYSLGVILFEMLTGSPPYQGSVVKVLNDAITAPLPEITNSLGEVSKDLKSVCRKALAKAVEDRYRSMGHFRDDCENYLVGNPTRANPSGPVKKLGRWCRRNRKDAVLLATAAVCLALIVAGTLGFSFYSESTASERERVLGLSRIQERELIAIHDDLQTQEESLEQALARHQEELESLEAIHDDLEQTQSDLEANQEQLQEVRRRLKNQVTERDNEIAELEIRLAELQRVQELRRALTGREGSEDNQNWTGFRTEIESALIALNENRLETADNYLNDCADQYRSTAWYLLAHLVDAKRHDRATRFTEPPSELVLVDVDDRAHWAICAPFWAANDKPLTLWNIRENQFQTSFVRFDRILAFSSELIVLRVGERQLLCCSPEQIASNELPAIQSIPRLGPIDQCQVIDDQLAVAVSIQNDTRGDSIARYEITPTGTEKLHETRFRSSRVLCATYRQDRDDILVIHLADRASIIVESIARDGEASQLAEIGYDFRLSQECEFLSESSEVLRYSTSSSEGYFRLSPSADTPLLHLTQEDINSGQFNFPELRDARIASGKLVIEDPLREQRLVEIDLGSGLQDVIHVDDHLLILQFDDGRWGIYDLRSAEPAAMLPAEPGTASETSQRQTHLQQELEVASS